MVSARYCTLRRNMHYIYWINKILLTLLGTSTGLVKIFGMEKEMELFRNAGFSNAATVAFGIVQVAATVLTWFPVTLRAGAFTLALTFVVATGVLFKNGMTTFGLVSILFIVMAIFAAFPPDR